MSRAILFRIVADILATAWDPIGVAGEPGTEDEYDAFVAPVAELLRNGAETEALSTELLVLERRDLGLPGDPIRSLKAAEALIAGFEKWRTAFERASATEPAAPPARFRFSPNALRYFRRLRRMHESAGDRPEVLVIWVKGPPPASEERTPVLQGWFTADAIMKRGGRIRTFGDLRIAIDVKPHLAILFEGALVDAPGPEGPAFLVTGTPSSAST